MQISIRKVAILNCVENGIMQTEFVTWKSQGEAVENDDRMHLMHNGSLIVFDPHTLQVNTDIFDKFN